MTFDELVTKAKEIALRDGEIMSDAEARAMAQLVINERENKQTQ